MKKISILLACISMSTSFSIAQALPKWASKAQKAVFSIVTYDKDNSILNTGNGFFIDEKVPHYPITHCLKEPIGLSLSQQTVKSSL